MVLDKLGFEVPLAQVRSHQLKLGGGTQCSVLSLLDFPFFANVNRNFNGKFETQETSGLIICPFFHRLLCDNFAQLASSKSF